MAKDKRGYSPRTSTLIPSIALLNPNRSLDRYHTVRYGENNFLSSFIFLLASCCSFVLDVARYAFELTTNHLLNNQIKSVQDLMTDLGLFSIKNPLLPLKKWDKPWSITEKSLNLQV